MSGSSGHKPDCPCPLCAGKIRTAAREAAEAEQAAVVRAAARAVAWMAAQMARQGGGSAPDVLRQALGRDDALRILRMAGMNAGPVAASWADAAPGRPAQSRSDFWDRFPDHDRDFVAGRRALPDVAADYDARRRERQAQRQSSVLWQTRDGTPVTDGGAAVTGASFGPSGAPVQRSAVNTGVPELGSEQV